jgi:hypothetical protein
MVQRTDFHVFVSSGIGSEAYLSSPASAESRRGCTVLGDLPAPMLWEEWRSGSTGLNVLRSGLHSAEQDSPDLSEKKVDLSSPGSSDLRHNLEGISPSQTCNVLIEYKTAVGV